MLKREVARDRKRDSHFQSFDSNGQLLLGVSPPDAAVHIAKFPIPDLLRQSNRLGSYLLRKVLHCPLDVRVSCGVHVHAVASSGQLYTVVHCVGIGMYMCVHVSCAIQ